MAIFGSRRNIGETPVETSDLEFETMTRDHESSDDPAFPFDRVMPSHTNAQFSQLPKSEPKNDQRNQAEEQYPLHYRR